MRRSHIPDLWFLPLAVAFCCLAGCASSAYLAQGSITPSIQSFTASPANIAAGGSAQLTANFSSGTGVITPGNMAVTSGVAVSVSPASTTTYTLTVTSTSGNTATATTTITVTALGAPAIASFAASPATITSGSSTQLTGVFSGGTGILTPGNVALTSGTPVSVSPASTATYTLTVTSTSGNTATATTTVTVTQATKANLGVNIGWINDWDRTQPFADAMKQSRKFGSVNAPYDETATVDANGWPAQDGGVLVIAGNQGTWSAGNYALSFTGQATVAAWGDANVQVGAVSYSSANNTSTATVTVGSAYRNLYLVFTNTKRTATSAMGTGVTNVSLMRPTITGAPHAAGTLFTDRFLARLKYFTAVRVKDYLSTDSSTEENWSDRATPTNASQQQVPWHASQNVQPQYITGASYEYAIQLANQTGKDLLLNVPHLAFGGTYAFTSTAWATNLALLVKYGSDASGNPYTGVSGSSGANPQPASGPVNPPLNAGLHVYLEYSNEFWSGVGSQTTWAQQQAAAAIAARDADLDWDSTGSTYTVEMRIAAKGTMLIANAFANVFGSSAFGVVYRPVLSSQISYSGSFVGLDYLETRQGGASQYVWAVGGAPYVDFNGDSNGNTLTSAQVLAGMQAFQTANIVPWIASLASTASTYGLKGGIIAYEGGQGAAYQTAGSTAAQTTPAMRGIVTTLLDTWINDGGGTFFYFKLCSEDNWGLATDIGYDIDADTGWTANPATSTETQPKWGAIKQVATLGQ
jgi:hypothetical protein